jgi:integrase
VSNKQVTPTKTGAPREVALTYSLVTLLRDHRRRLIEGQHIGLSSGLVFPSRVGSHRFPNSLEKVFKKAATATEIAFRVTPQVLRRTFNTLMVQAGVDRIVLRSQMGHCSEEMTERYAGVGIESKREAVARLHQSS